MKEVPSMAEVEILFDELDRLTRTFLRRWAWGQRLESQIIDDVQAEARVRLIEEMQRLDLAYSPRENRDPRLHKAMSTAAGGAVNYWRDQVGGRRWEDETTPHDPRSTAHHADAFNQFTMPLELIADRQQQVVVDGPDELTISFGDPELDAVAQGLADGLSYRQIADRLGRPVETKAQQAAARQWVSNRVRTLRAAITGL